MQSMNTWERSGSVVECLTQGQGVQVRASLASLCCVLDPSLVLVQPRKTRPHITERMLMGRKESNQTKSMNSPHLTTWVR